MHAARLRPGRPELLWWSDVWDELERRGAIVAIVPFSGRAGRGGQTATIRLSRLQNGESVDVEVWTSCDELAYAVEAPVRDRYGTFVGQPWIPGEVLWTAEDRCVVIVGRRGEQRFEEIAR